MLDSIYDSAFAAQLSKLESHVETSTICSKERSNDGPAGHELTIQSAHVAYGHGHFSLAHAAKLHGTRQSGNTLNRHAAVLVLGVISFPTSILSTEPMTTRVQIAIDIATARRRTLRRHGNKTANVESIGSRERRTLYV